MIPAPGMAGCKRVVQSTSTNYDVTWGCVSMRITSALVDATLAARPNCFTARVEP